MTIELDTVATVRTARSRKPAREAQAAPDRRALWLDAPDQAVLVRDGPPPTAADVRSCYNVQVLETLLFQVKPADPLTLVAVSVLLLGVAVAAALVPARRATRVDPVVVLRYE